jgi:heme-degrading monooxygenase HmoA
MAVKIVIERKIKPGKENEFGEALRDLRSRAIHAQGYIFGESLRGIEDPSLHMVISTWNSLADWNRWADSEERKAFQRQTDALLEEPTKVIPYQHESTSLHAHEMLTALASDVRDQ